MFISPTRSGIVRFMAGFFALFVSLSLAAPVEAEMTAFRQAVASSAARDKDIAAFYQSREYKPFWTAANAGARRRALIEALSDAPEHGLPARRYDVEGLLARLDAARTPKARGIVEVEMSRVFVQYARDVQTGVLVPGRVVSDIKREVPYRERLSYLENFARSHPRGFFRALPPDSNEYTRLMKEKKKLESLLGAGGWGAQVPAGALKPADTGAAVVALRNRLIAMGFLRRTTTQSYDAAIQKAVQQFQLAHGLEADGVAGASTMAEINKDAGERLQSVLVAMERERWMNMPRGERHILVNLTDFTARVMDNDTLTFETRSVVGATASDRRSPEFSDVMEFMVINPTWNVPRSIAVKEYLPMFQRNPNAAGHLRLVDSRGRTVSRSAVNFGAYTARTFPFNIKQPPGQRNALGLVKFMFPNKYNIYLHDTPAKNLFSREVRAFSHGCIRLQEPFDFAYTLLSRQTDDPEGFFRAKLNTGVETVVPLEQPVPVHLIYRTAFTKAKGHMQYRRDIYGRDAQIWSALSEAGVALRAVQG
ncbi:Murein L,D-transpeptidase YcbB/YkuD [Lutimaribacter pacificus]|uniref:Murein L,D-transpeptidase YcbB/YkuD n=1 Tax=Lutimaribacter pacificus TaxID=391948 RepID=A0A1H0EVL7_9RHOB|nr:Murein L,D-transpeptidase YcbB/YkuD [Lutimaribacter pacificus]SHK41712.1 Murein L,D-transpeptidase YcbB/YkuD [Lutimaribacter pacificus]